MEPWGKMVKICEKMWKNWSFEWKNARKRGKVVDFNGKIERKEENWIQKAESRKTVDFNRKIGRNEENWIQKAESQKPKAENLVFIIEIQSWRNLTASHCISQQNRASHCISRKTSKNPDFICNITCEKYGKFGVFNGKMRENVEKLRRSYNGQIGRNEENWIQKAESRKLGVYYTNSKVT